jgi:hypothetical protein
MVCREEQFGGSNPKQVEAIVLVIIVITLIWGCSRRWTTNLFNTALSSSDQVLWHCTILMLFFVLKVSTALVLVALLK